MLIVKALRFKKVEEETFESLFEEAFGEKKYIFIEEHHFVECFFFFFFWLPHFVFTLVEQNQPTFVKRTELCDSS